MVEICLKKNNNIILNLSGDNIETAILNSMQNEDGENNIISQVLYFFGYDFFITENQLNEEYYPDGNMYLFWKNKLTKKFKAEYFKMAILYYAIENNLTLKIKGKEEFKG